MSVFDKVVENGVLSVEASILRDVKARLDIGGTLEPEDYENDDDDLVISAYNHALSLVVKLGAEVYGVDEAVDEDEDEDDEDEDDEESDGAADEPTNPGLEKTK